MPKLQVYNNQYCHDNYAMNDECVDFYDNVTITKKKNLWSKEVKTRQTQNREIH